MSLLHDRGCARRVGPLLCAVVLAALVCVPAGVSAAGTGSESNGAFAVQIQAGGVWTTVSTISFGLHYSTGMLDLPADVDQVRLVQSGGTAAQLDFVRLGGQAPSSVSGSSDAAVIKKLAADDNDVTNALGDVLTLEFPAAASRLEIDARVQGDISAFVPFQFPVANVGKPVTAASEFYSYAVGGAPSLVDTAAEPFLKVFCVPGSGHPSGYTYVWVASDAKNLLVTMDFTPDNTLDGNQDYATVHVKTAGGVKAFRVSVDEKTWGDVDFVYTDKVGYQHKLYTFRIPWAEVGPVSGTLGFAFTAYGTASVGPLPPPPPPPLVKSGTSVGRPLTRFRVARGSSALVYGYLSKRHALGTDVVALKCYHLEKGIWVLLKTVPLKAKGLTRSHRTKYAGYVHFPSSGRWRLVAVHADPGFLVDTSAPRYFWVR